jgi:hypothetical protein
VFPLSLEGIALHALGWPSYLAPRVVLLPLARDLGRWITLPLLASGGEVAIHIAELALPLLFSRLDSGTCWQRDVRLDLRRLLLDLLIDDYRWRSGRQRCNHLDIKLIHRSPQPTMPINKGHTGGGATTFPSTPFFASFFHPNFLYIGGFQVSGRAL